MGLLGAGITATEGSVGTSAQAPSSSAAPSVMETIRMDMGMLLLSADDHVDAAVVFAAFGGVVAGDGIGFALADGGDAVGGDAVRDQVLAHGFRAALRQFVVARGIADVVGMAFHHDAA